MSRVIQITDLHIASPPHKVSQVLDTHGIFQHTIEKIRSDLPKISPIDAIIVTGDVSDKGDTESYRAFKNQIEALELPYFLIPGNHDNREAIRNTFSDHRYLPSEGELNWVKSLPNFTVIGLDSTIPNSGGGELSNETLAFLLSALERSEEKPALIALHHPPFVSGIQFMDNIRLNNIKSFEAIITQAKQDIRIICGHLHNSIVCNIGHATVISCPAIASEFLTDYRDNARVGFVESDGGYMIHDWDHGFRSAFVPLKTAEKIHPF